MNFICRQQQRKKDNCCWNTMTMTEIRDSALWETPNGGVIEARTAKATIIATQTTLQMTARALICMNTPVAMAHTTTPIPWMKSTTSRKKKATRTLRCTTEMITMKTHPKRHSDTLITRMREITKKLNLSRNHMRSKCSRWYREVDRSRAKSRRRRFTSTSNRRLLWDPRRRMFTLNRSRSSFNRLHLLFTTPPPNPAIQSLNINRQILSWSLWLWK